MQVRQTDLAGNLSPVNSGFAAFTVDTAAAAPSLALAADTGSSSSDRITSNASISISGLEAGASWEYSIDAGGSWLAGTDTSFELASGSYGAGSILVRNAIRRKERAEDAGLQPCALDMRLSTFAAAAGKADKA